MGLPTTRAEWDRSAAGGWLFDGRASNGEAGPALVRLYHDLSRAALGDDYAMTTGYVYGSAFVKWKGTYHAGIDIDAPGGTAVRALADGIVVRADSALDAQGFDSAVVVYGDDGHYWLYGHVDETPATSGLVGGRVEAGDRIGTVRDDPNDHLHLGVLEVIPNGYAYQTVGGYGHFRTLAGALRYTDNPLQAYHDYLSDPPAGPPYAVTTGTNGKNVLTGGAGGDLIRAGGGNDRAGGGGGTDLVYGDGGNDVLKGGGGDDILNGATGDDVLFGNGGNDLLQGGAGDDVLAGGLGIDNLYGNAGADRFVFYTIGESKVQGGAWDLIQDFEPGLDTIDLRPIDADATKSGNQAFAFAPDADGTKAGQLAVDVTGGWVYAAVDDRLGWDMIVSFDEGLGIGRDDFLL